MSNCVKENIIKVAETLFVKYGLRSVSIDDICKEIRISKKTFYVEFAHKEDLIETILSKLLEDRKLIDKEILASTTNNVIDDFLIFRNPLSKERAKKLEKFYYDLLKYYPEVNKSHYDKRRAQLVHEFSMYINKGITEAYFRDDIDIEVVATLFVNWYYALIESFINKKREEKEYVHAQAMDCMLRMLLNENGLKYYLECNNKN